jgi:hypothetical protein
LKARSSFFRSRNSISHYIAARFVCQLKHGTDSLTKENGKQASHPCGNKGCIWHLFSENDKENKSRDACHQFGCAKICPHRQLPTELCIFQKDGEFLPCRNNQELEECVCERGDCFEAGKLFIKLFDFIFDF